MVRRLCRGFNEFASTEWPMIHLRRVWVGKDIVEQLKTDGSAAPVPLGDLLADALRG